MTAEAPAMHSVTSRDGATIAYWRGGSGPPLVLVHGSISDRTAWGLVQPALEERFTIYAMHRRGRDGSAPMTRHDVEDECHDVAAVVDAVAETAGEPVHLFGHSFGAHCALGATRLTSNVRSLALYEPPPPGMDEQEDMLARLRELFEAGRHEDVVAEFLMLGPGLSEAQVAAMRQAPIWGMMSSHAQTLVEEIDALARYQFDASTFASLDMPLLLLLGEQSNARLRSVTEQLLAVLPQARPVELAGQAHAAHLGAPDLFASELRRFLEAVED